ncbi:hypothetical protein KY330_03415 [Candidatus Woesearchaeota archaeon]|nr:hypothetical protein [Candidatus Woesearchaeota archaeon]
MTSMYKKVVFLLVLVLLANSIATTYYNISNRIKELSPKTSGGTTSTVTFTVLETYSIDYNLFRKDTNLDYTFFDEGTPGIPMGVNITVGLSNGSAAPNATIKVIERNGYSGFAPVQFWPTGSPTSGLKQFAIAEIYTNGEESVNFTIVPTGGKDFELYNSLIGNNSITIEAYINGVLEDTAVINLSTTDIPSYNGTKYNVPNENWVSTTRDKILFDYQRIREWQALGGGDSEALAIYTNNSDNGTAFNLTAGRISGFMLTVLDNETLNPVYNATVRIYENNGYSIFCPVQLWPIGSPTSGISVTEYAESYTDTDGKVNFTIIPTGGADFALHSGLIGEYNLSLKVFNGSTELYSRSFTLYDDSLGTAASGTVEDIPNDGWISTTRDKVLFMYQRIRSWIDYAS